jgi:hypothetical protein
MNFYHIGKEVYRFNIFNLNADSQGFAGQYRIYWHRESEKYVVGKFGGFGSLTWFPSVKMKLILPDKKQNRFLRPIINKRLRCAYFYDGDKSCGQGDFLIKKMTRREKAGEYLRWMKMWCVFEKDMLFEDDNKVDEEAVKMLNAGMA